MENITLLVINILIFLILVIIFVISYVDNKYSFNFRDALRMGLLLGLITMSLAITVNQTNVLWSHNLVSREYIIVNNTKILEAVMTKTHYIYLTEDNDFRKSRYSVAVRDIATGTFYTVDNTTVMKEYKRINK